MPRTISMIGIEPDELPWLRLLVSLLRHPDPVVPELARQALLYLQAAASKSGQSAGQEACGTKAAASKSVVTHIQGDAVVR